MTSPASVGFVHLGGKLPTYAKANLKLVKEKFPNRRIVLISDEIANNGIKGVDFFLFDSSSITEKYRSFSSLDSTFRGGFWIHTMARFAAIADYMSRVPKRPLVHFELDVWLADDFPFSVFEALGCDTAYSLPSISEGSAAVIYLRDWIAATKLSTIFLDSIREVPESTDMTILRKIYDESLMDVRPLPMNPEQVILGGSDFGGYFFDPSSWGMFFLGQDPRNARGLQIFHRKEKHHEVNPSHYEVRSDGRTIQVLKNSNTFFLANLHVHSKDLRFFRRRKQSCRSIKKYLSRKPRSEYVEFKIKIFIRQLAFKVAKEVKILLRLFPSD
jgi:hypothetical protein